MRYWPSSTPTRAIILAAFAALQLLSGTSAASAPPSVSAAACTAAHCLYLPVLAAPVALAIVRNDHIASNYGCGRAGCFYLYDLYSQVENRGSATLYDVTAEATVEMGDSVGHPITATVPLSMMPLGLPPGQRAPLASGSFGQSTAYRLPRIIRIRVTGYATAPHVQWPHPPIAKIVGLTVVSRQFCPDADRVLTLRLRNDTTDMVEDITFYLLPRSIAYGPFLGSQANRIAPGASVTADIYAANSTAYPDEASAFCDPQVNPSPSGRVYAQGDVPAP